MHPDGGDRESTGDVAYQHQSQPPADRAWVSAVAARAAPAPSRWAAAVAPAGREEPEVFRRVAQDLAAGRDRFQVRLRWAQETDGDDREDYASMEPGNNYFGTGNIPVLVVTYGP